MAQSLAKIYLHIIFSTKNREDFINSNIEKELHKYIAGILKNLKCTAIKIGGTSNHIHILKNKSYFNPMALPCVMLFFPLGKIFNICN